MCGIIGIIGDSSVSQDIVDALKCLEYRGYDSAGIATLDQGKMHCLRAVGKLKSLEDKMEGHFLPGNIGIGHTRWATHGEPSEKNAHPHTTNKVAVVHNGIIENFEDLRAFLLGKGYSISTKTDTEVIAKLLTFYLDADFSMEEALGKVLQSIEGSFSFTIITPLDPDKIYFARKGSPLVIGVSENGNYIASDAIALAPYTQQVIYPEDGDWGYITQYNHYVFKKDNTPVDRQIHTLTLNTSPSQKGNFRHFMEKEIFEQPAVLKETLMHYLTADGTKLSVPKLSFDIKKIKRFIIIACGTSYYAAFIAKYWIESYTGIPVDIDFASEFRYRNPALGKDQQTACFFISQSGETIDTLEALRYVKEKGLPTVGIVNVSHSAISRESDSVWPTFAGHEIGVASTKAFTCQLMVLAILTLEIAREREYFSEEKIEKLIDALKNVPTWLDQVSRVRTACLEAARTLVKSRDILYLGRGTNFPIALEGALKIKEISYIHAEAYAAGEMKHGPIALIDEQTPIVAICSSDGLSGKTISNLQEAAARGGKIISICDANTLNEVRSFSVHTIEMPIVPAFVQPFINTLPMQLLAYETAVLKGTDVDQPRNLAKSVTVE